MKLTTKFAGIIFTGYILNLIIAFSFRELNTNILLIAIIGVAWAPTFVWLHHMLLKYGGGGGVEYWKE